MVSRWRRFFRRGLSAPVGSGELGTTTSRQEVSTANVANSDTSADGLAARLVPYMDHPGLLHLALSHRSYCAEAPGEPSNERLEFLGDSVLGLVVTEYLYRTHSELPEGDLARMRSAVVSTEALAPIAASLGVGDALLLGRGEATSGGRTKDSILADALEAIIGAVYLASGLDAARSFVLALLAKALEGAANLDVLGDAKNRLQELAARLGAAAPTYRVRGDGPDHARHFSAEVELGGKVVGRGEGRSKKLAERGAAEQALEALSASGQSPDDVAESRRVPSDERISGSLPQASSS